VALIEGDVLGDADPDQGREGMTYWQIGLVQTRVTESQAE